VDERRKSKVRVTGVYKETTALVNAVRMVNVYTVGGIWRMGLNY